MLIGLCGGDFANVRRALQEAIPTAQLVNIADVATSSTRIPQVDVLTPLGATVDADLMDATQPRLIQQFGVGLQGVDRDAARSRGISVANVPAGDTGNANAVAEVGMLHLLALLRDYPIARRNVTRKRVGQPCGTTLVGKTATVLGAGTIGTALIDRLAAFGVVPLAVGRRGYADYPALQTLLPPERYYRSDDLTAALARSQILVVCCPLTKHTRGLVGTDQLTAMPAGGYLVNVARGAVVDYRALLQALCTGQLAGAGLDVTWTEPIDPDDPLLAENVTVTPHIGGVTRESYAAIAEEFATNVHNLQTNQPLAHLTS